MQTSVMLSINNRTRVIPGTDSDHSAEMKFKPLKGRVEDVAEIPEVRDSDALKQALERINSSSTAFFTVACAKACNSEAGRFWARGSIEFAFNYVEIVRDSPNYFLLFEQFNRHVLEAQFDVPVDFNFQLEGAHFAAISAVGYTARVWITTAEFAAIEQAQKVWNQSIGFLTDFLCSFEKPEMGPIY